MGVRNLEEINHSENILKDREHLRLVENYDDENESQQELKYTVLSLLFTFTLSLTMVRLFSTAYHTLKSLYSPEVFVAMGVTFNEVYQNVVFSAYCFEIGLSATFAILYFYNVITAIRRKKSMKKVFLLTQGGYLLAVFGYNCLVTFLLGSTFQLGLILSNLLYLAIWYSYLKFNERAQLVFVR